MNMQLSEIIGKRIVSITAAKDLGTVRGVHIDPATYEIKGISTDEDMRMLPLDSVYAVNDILTTADMSLSETNGKTLCMNIGASVYTSRGKYVGKVSDVTLGGKRKSVKTDAGNLSLKRIGASGKELVILAPAVKKSLPVLAAPVENDIRSEVRGAFPAERNSYGFLLGKRVTREVSDIGRSFVLMAGTLITDGIIKNALKAGKIADLVATSAE